MKARWRYDDRDLGPATDAVRQIIARWLRIDWFGQPVPGAIDRAHAAWEHHLACTRLHAREAYAPDVRIAPRVGTWSDFAALYRVAVAAPSFDWKFGVLKPLLQAHRSRHGFRVERSTPGVVPLEQLSHGGPQPLWAALPEHGVVTLGPQIGASPEELFAASPHAAWQRASRYRNAVGSYTSYATQDAMFAIEWQLAAPPTPLDDNPFVPLLAVYEAGAYPFVMSASEVVLFSFRQPTWRDAFASERA